MTDPRTHPIRLGVSVLLVALAIAALAVAADGTPNVHVASSQKYQFVASHDGAGAGTDPSIARERKLLFVRASHDARTTLTSLRERPRDRLKVQQELKASQPSVRHGSSGSTASTGSGGSSGGGVDWDAIAQCESGGNWAINSGNGYWGGLQFSPSTWFANGGGPFDGSGPFPYSRSQQISVAQRVYAQVGLSAWPYCGRFG